MLIIRSILLILIASCLGADSPNKVLQGLLITAYRVLMISHAALGSKVRQSNHHWTSKGLIFLVDFHICFTGLRPKFQETERCLCKV